MGNSKFNLDNIIYSNIKGSGNTFYVKKEKFDGIEIVTEILQHKYIGTIIILSVD